MTSGIITKQVQYLFLITLSKQEQERLAEEGQMPEVNKFEQVQRVSVHGSGTVAGTRTRGRDP